MGFGQASGRFRIWHVWLRHVLLKYYSFELTFSHLLSTTQVSYFDIVWRGKTHLSISNKQTNQDALKRFAQGSAHISFTLIFLRRIIVYSRCLIILGAILIYNNVFVVGENPAATRHEKENAVTSSPTHGDDDVKRWLLNEIIMMV